MALEKSTLHSLSSFATNMQGPILVAAMAMGLGSPGPLEHLWWRALTFEKPWLHCMTGFCSGKWRWMPVVTLSRVLCTTGHWLSCVTYMPWAMSTLFVVTLSSQLLWPMSCSSWMLKPVSNGRVWTFALGCARLRTFERHPLHVCSVVC